MLRMIRSKFSRTRAFLDCNLKTVRENKSGCASDEATGGDKRRSFCKGSRRFSKLSAFELKKQSTIAELKLLFDKRCSSTLAVSSCSLGTLEYMALQSKGEQHTR